jgi:hypothetical protein
MSFKALKFTHGIWGLIAIGSGAIAISVIGLSDAKVSNYQQVSIHCTLEKKTESEECKSLIKFGIDPTLFITDKTYKKEVDKKYMDAIQSNSVAAPAVAEFTLKHSLSKKITLPIDI